jgi:hypothetical protein
MRDSAMAALLGISPASPRGADFGAEFGDDDYGADEYDADVDYGAEFGAGRPRRPNMGHLMALHQREQVRKRHQNRRAMHLNPNAGSAIKVERYSFSINQTIAALGTPSAINATGNPQVKIRAQRVIMNAPSVGFALIAEIKMANVSVTSGGVADAFEFSSLGQGVELDCPTLTPANTATVLGNYTGLVPSPLTGTGAYTFVASFKGPSTMAGG